MEKQGSAKTQGELNKFRKQVITPEMFIEKIADISDNKKEMRNVYPGEVIEPLLFEEWPVGIVKYKRVYAIMKAYGLLAELETYHPVNSFINGLFINDRYDVSDELENKLEEYSLVDERLAAYNLKRFYTKKGYREFFNGIMKYRFHIYSLFNCFEGDLIMPFGMTVACYGVINGLEDAYLNPMKNRVDEILLDFLRDNFTVRNYTVGEL